MARLGLFVPMRAALSVAVQLPKETHEPQAPWSKIGETQL